MPGPHEGQGQFVGQVEAVSRKQLHQCANRKSTHQLYDDKEMQIKKKNVNKNLPYESLCRFRLKAAKVLIGKSFSWHNTIQALYASACDRAGFPSTKADSSAVHRPQFAGTVLVNTLSITCSLGSSVSCWTTSDWSGDGERGRGAGVVVGFFFFSVTMWVTLYCMESCSLCVCGLRSRISGERMCIRWSWT